MQSNPAGYDLLRPLWFGFTVLNLLSAIVLSVISWRRTSGTARQETGLCMAGIITGVVPFTLLIFVPPMFGVDFIVSPYIVAPTFVLLPLSQAVAMLQSQFTRVAPLLRRSVARLTTWAVLSTIILTPLVIFAVPKELAVVIAILAFALAEQPVRSVVLQGLLAEPKPRLIRLDPEELLNYLLELAQAEQVRRGIPEDDAASPDHAESDESP